MSDPAAGQPAPGKAAAPAHGAAGTQAAGYSEKPGSTTTVLANVGAMLRASAPKSYVVRPGDTLWGIATLFLKNPWVWPEIWYLNPQIHNPHRIYPGDTVRLALAQNGRESLQVVRRESIQVVPGPKVPTTVLRPQLRSTALRSPIPSVPYRTIAAFLSRPGVLTRAQIDAAPYVLALQGSHQIAGAGTDLYIRRLSGRVGMRYDVMHIDGPLVDPSTGRHLGYLAVYTGTARLIRPGRIATADLVRSARETLRGDVLVPESGRQPAGFVPRPPAGRVSGRVIAVVNNVLVAGQYDVVALDVGSSDGLERGDVLNVDHARQRATDPCPVIDGNSTCWFHSSVLLPSERAGNVLVFKVYPHLSFALVSADRLPIHVDDRVLSP